MAAEQFRASDELITQMLGDELRKAREAAGLTRAQLIERMPSTIHPQTLATYENGIRQCTVVRLEEVCNALRIEAPELLAVALQRARTEPFTRTLRIDLPALLRDRTSTFALVRTWAENFRADSDGSDTARLEPAAVRALAFVVGVPQLDLIEYLMTFTPKAEPRA